ncbi:MAG: PD-(D/E)XK nuclease family protein [Tissierellia bacterium]|nr:PD-(D/E)XK nuclease family protein [Tissierellia bacterium]
MSNKIVYLGPFNNENKIQLKNRCISYLKDNKGSNFYYILPNGDLLKKYRRDFINELGSVFELNIFTFDDIVKSIIKEDTYKTIDEPFKKLIMRNTLKQLKSEGKLSYYKDFINMEGFIEVCMDIVREIKRSLITPDEFIKRCPNNLYYKEIGLIYKEYERILIDRNLTDRENDYLNCINKLKNNLDYLVNIDFIVIDEFFDFRPVEIEIIKELTKKEIDIFINIPFKSTQNNIVLNHSIEKLRNLGFEIEITDYKTKNKIELLSDKIFGYDDNKLDYMNNIDLVKCPSTYIELKKVFREIKIKLSKGFNLDDMAIVILSESYSNNLYKISDEEKIPLKKSKKTSMNKIPIIKEFLKIIKTKLSEGAKEDLLSRIKSAYFPIVNNDLKDELEYEIRKLNFSSMDELKVLINSSQRLNINDRSIGNILDLMQRIDLEFEFLLFEDKVSNYNKNLVKLIQDYDVESIIFQNYNMIKDYDMFYRDLMALQKLKDIINIMNDINLIEEKITLEDYLLVLEDFCSQEEIFETDETINGLTILNPINSRGLKHKFLFVVGLSQEEYPRLDDKNYFLSNENYDVLKEIGIDIMNYYERFSNEALKFSSLISSCSHNLYLSYNENSLEEGKNIPSIFLDELLSKINGEKIEDKLRYSTIDLDYLINSPIDSITSKKDVLNTFLYKYFNDEIEEQYIPQFIDTFKNEITAINKIVDLEEERKSKEFNKYKGFLDNDKIRGFISEKLNDKVYSISYLEGYAKCPYYFQLHDFFKVEEMGRKAEDFDNFDIGSIYHEVLHYYYEKYKDQLLDNKISFDVEDTFDYIKELTYKYASMKEYNEDNINDNLLIDNIYNKLKSFIKKDIQRIKESKDNILPWEFEYEFGRDTPLLIQTSYGDVRFRGKIDRIDKSIDNDKYVVIDYKSSPYGKRDLDSIEKGLSLQLPVYIMSQESRDVIAGVYSILSNGEYYNAIGVLGEASFITKRQKGSVEREDWDNTLEKTKDIIGNIVREINNGNFSVNPLECSPFCPYKDICRYENIDEGADE